MVITYVERGFLGRTLTSAVSAGIVSASCRRSNTESRTVNVSSRVMVVCLMRTEE